MSLKKNYIASLFQVLINLVFPIVTFPYLARMLGPESIGKVEYANAIVFYFLTFMHLGIPLYGTREVARYQNDKEKLNKIISEITMIYLIMSISIGVIFYSYVIFGPIKKDLIILLLISGLNIFISSFSLNWVNQGLEKHRFLALVNLLGKGINLTLILLLINDQEDYITYMSISVFFNLIVSLGGSFIALRTVNISFINLNIKSHLKPIVLTSGINIAESLFFQMNIIMLGSILSAVEVGIYSAAFRFIRLSEGVVSILTKISMPRVSFYTENEMEKQLSKLLEKILFITLVLSIPVSFGIFSVSREIILLFAGDKFTDSIQCLQILSLTILLTTINSFLYNQILFPSGKDHLLIIRGLVILATNFLLNLYLIPKFASSGAAISLLITTTLSLIILGHYSKPYIKSPINSFENLKIVLSGSIMALVLYLLKHKLASLDLVFILILKVIIGALVFMSSLIILNQKKCIIILRNIIKN